MAAPERTPQERETLIFRTPQEARDFRERVSEQLSQQPVRGVTRGREVVAAAVEREFAKHGEAAGLLPWPWEHTPEEHSEVQSLVDMAFAHDVEAALRRARRSNHYPRNVDLLHDVLTSELYALLQQREINRAPVAVRLVMMSAVILVALVLIIVLLAAL